MWSQFIALRVVRVRWQGIQKCEGDLKAERFCSLKPRRFCFLLLCYKAWPPLLRSSIFSRFSFGHKIMTERSTSDQHTGRACRCRGIPLLWIILDEDVTVTLIFIATVLFLENTLSTLRSKQQFFRIIFCGTGSFPLILFLRIDKLQFYALILYRSLEKRLVTQTPRSDR